MVWFSWGVCLAQVLKNILACSTSPGGGEEEVVTQKAQGIPPRSPSWEGDSLPRTLAWKMRFELPTAVAPGTVALTA